LRVLASASAVTCWREGATPSARSAT
jgi:hypothetical protein